ncbi:murein hydrolase activator EnvC [Neorhizobium petrolearium]
MRITGMTSYRHALLLAAAFGFALIPPPDLPASARAQETDLPPRAAPPSPVDPTADLQRRRNETRGELEVLTKNMKLSADKAAAIEKNIADIRKNSADIRQALIDSATRRKNLEKKILESEKKIAEFKVKEDGIRASLHGRRAVLAEVLAALQRMGRNPPPALLVTPEDALASVRSAILLGAVVPGMRHEADKLIADLQSLTSLQAAALAEKTDVSNTIAASLEEDRRMDLLLAENEKLNKRNIADLDAERRRSEELAARAGTLDNLIQSLEGEIASVREAIDRARAEEERQRMLSEAERERAKQLAESGVPDKNRIAPAYAFSSLKQKLELPVAGDVLRWFGDADGTGHTARGMTIASSPGAVVTAPADGLVVFAGAFRSYGQMIILNAGDGYHLVLTGMDEVNARQGKFVFSGEPIAVMGEKRVASATALALETDRPTLYIEFRKDGTPVDSRPWWTAKETGRARNDS